MSRASVLYVHGAFVSDPEWWWGKVAALLRDRGIESATTPLPSCGEKPQGDLEADTLAVREALDSIAGPVLAVAHSYGGMPATAAADGAENVFHLLYISAPVPDGGSMLESDWISADAGAAADVDLREDGTAGEFPDRFAARLLDGVDPEVRRQASDRLTRQSIAAYGQKAKGAAWRSIDSTYLLCLRDGDVAVEVQRRQAERAGSRQVEVDSNHYPQLERPGLVADLVTEIVELQAG